MSAISKLKSIAAAGTVTITAAVGLSSCATEYYGASATMPARPNGSSSLALSDREARINEARHRALDRGDYETAELLANDQTNTRSERYSARQKEGYGRAIGARNSNSAYQILGLPSAVGNQAARTFSNQMRREANSAVYSIFRSTTNAQELLSNSEFFNSPNKIKE